MSRARCARGAGAPPRATTRRPNHRLTARVLTFFLPAHPTQVVSDIRPEPELKQDYIERNPVITTVQVVPDLSEHEVRPATASPRSQSRCRIWRQTTFFFFGISRLGPLYANIVFVDIKKKRDATRTLASAPLSLTTTLTRNETLSTRTRTRRRTRSRSRSPTAGSRTSRAGGRRRLIRRSRST